MIPYPNKLELIGTLRCPYCWAALGTRTVRPERDYEVSRHHLTDVQCTGCGQVFSPRELVQVLRPVCSMA
jgi:hypothetical protein